MAEKYTDVSNKEKLTFCIRWVMDDLDLSEKFLGINEIPNKYVAIQSQQYAQ